MNKIKIIGTALMAVALGSTAMAQSENTAVRLMSEPNNTIGSARYQAMSGSMGAMGTDYSASINTNPAGLALFRSGKKLSLTLGIRRYYNDYKWYSSSVKNNSDLNFNLDQLSYISSMKKDYGIGFSFGFGYQRGATFNRDINIQGDMNGRGTSFADYVAASINRYKGYNKNIPIDDFTNAGAYDNMPWLMVLGVRDNWVTSDDPSGNLYHSNFVTNPSSIYTAAKSASLHLHEEGGISKYSFSTGFEVNKSLHMGLSLGFTTLNYKLSTGIDEDHRASSTLSGAGKEFLNYNSIMNIRGSGVNIGFGIIAEPVEGLRLGAGVFSPTYYVFNQTFYASASSVTYQEDKSHKTIRIDTKDETPQNGANEFAIKSPWRFTLSGAYILGHRAIINIDYEASMIGSIRLSDPDSYQESDNNSYSMDNSAIKEDFNVRNTIKIGAELNVTNRFTLRAGASYMTSGVASNLFDKNNLPTREMLVDGLAPSYSVIDNISGLSAGFGYKISPKLSIDFAFTDNITKSRTYAFPAIGDPAEGWINNTNKEAFLEGYAPVSNIQHLFNTAATISYRF